MAVVDPGVGTARRPIALHVGRGDYLVGPDNGLLVPAARALGGIVAARALENRALWLPNVSHTFHGRDIFSPVGRASRDRHAVRHRRARRSTRRRSPTWSCPSPRHATAGLDTSVLLIDAFGNCRLAGETSDLVTAFGEMDHGRQFDLVLPARGGASQRPASRVRGSRPSATCRSATPLLFEDADYAGPALAVNQGSAAEALGLELDTPVRLEPA